MDNREDENLNDEELENMDLQKQQEAQLEQQQSELEEQQKEQIAAKKTQAAISSIGSKIKGGAKEAGKQVAKMVKKAILAFVKAIGIKGLIIFIIIIAAAALIYGVISGISDLLSDKANNIMSEDFIRSSSTYDADVDFSNGIEITDEQVEQLIKVIENQGISLNSMFLSGDQDDSQDENSEANKKQKIKYLRQFLLAQLCTEYPDFGIQEDETHYNGIIKIRKNNSDGSDSTDMKYVKLQVFKAMINAINDDRIDSNLLNGYTLDEIKEEIKNIYTIDGSGNLYFANWHTEEVTENSKTEKKTTVTEQAVNYLKTVEKYSMPIQTSIALCFISQNPEYVYNFIQEHVLAGEIVISVQEHESVDTFNSWFDWQITETTREYTYTEIDPDVWDWYTTGTSQNTTQYNDQNHYKKIVTDVQCVAAVTNVDTWMFKETVEYTNVPNMVEYPLGEETKVYNDATCPVTVPTNTSTISGDATSRSRTDKSYSLDYCNFTQTEKMVYNDWQKGTVNVDTAEIERKADSIIAQWKNKFRIPNSNKSEVPFVKIYDAKDMFLNMLNNNEKTQKQAEIFKFLIERTKNGGYSLDNLDMSIYKNTDLETIDVEEDIIVNVSRSQSNIVLSKEQVKKAIESCYSGQAMENLLGALNDFMYIQNNNKVNAIFAVAVVTQESSAGTNWARIDSSTYNWMSCKAESGQQYYTDSTGTKWAKYTSFGNATRDLGRRISTESYYFGGGNYTVRTIGQSYCVPPDGWINGVISNMKRLFKSVGVDLDAERKQHNRPQHNGTQGDSDNSNNNNNGNNGNNGNNTNSGNNATGQVELDGSYNVNGVRLSNPIIDPISFVGSYANHGAVDINPTDNGPVPVYAAAAGTVTKAGWEGTYGNRVVIDHGSGVSTCYAHASSVVVSAGQHVEKGQLIMYQGSTGNSSGPHVHFEIRINGSRIQSLAEDMFAKLGFPITRNY